MSKYQQLGSEASNPFDDDDDIIIQPDNNTNSSLPTSKPIPISQPIMQDVNIESMTPPQPLFSTPASRVRKTYEGGVFSLNYYRQFFDLDTNEFFHNCFSSMNPLAKPSDEDFTTVGDLYGSIWVTATIVFLLFFCNSFAELLSNWIFSNKPDNMNINYFKMLVASINLLYGYSIVIPAILYILLRFYFKVVFLIPLTKLFSIYSYANLLWTPAVLLSIFRGLLINHQVLDTVLKWCCIAIGALLSGSSIIVKINHYFGNVFGEEEKKQSFVLLALLLLAHAGFALGVKVSFFGKL